MSAVTHMVLSQVSLEDGKLFEQFDPLQKQKTIILRDIVFIMLTVNELVKQTCGNEAKLKEISDSLLIEIQTNY